MKKEQYIFGIHPLLEAIDAGKTIDKVWIQRGMNPETTQGVVSQLKRGEIPFQYVPKAKLDQFTRGNHQGVVTSISPIEFSNIEWLLPALYEKGETPFLLILDRISDVRNFGAICRSAECAGVHAIIIPAKGAAQINADSIKTSAGAALRIPICRVPSIVQTINFLTESGIEIIACFENGEEPYFEADLDKPFALMMGSEDDGISKNNLQGATTSIRIPMAGKTASLNVSVATGIILFEALKQRALAS